MQDAQPKKRGRPSIAPEDRTKVHSIRLTEARIQKLKSLGMPWLVKAIDRARDKP